jgi:hypothetical protein
MVLSTFASPTSVLDLAGDLALALGDHQSQDVRVVQHGFLLWKGAGASPEWELGGCACIAHRRSTLGGESEPGSA